MATAVVLAGLGYEDAEDATPKQRAFARLVALLLADVHTIARWKVEGS